MAGQSNANMSDRLDYGTNPEKTDEGEFVSSGNHAFIVATHTDIVMW